MSRLPPSLRLRAGTAITPTRATSRLRRLCALPDPRGFRRNVSGNEPRGLRIFIELY